jgi:hypothetical protein
MPNPFQRYQSGGFEPIQGLAQSGANIGQMLGSGIANFGSSIAKGLEAYNENKAKFGAAMADGEIAGSQLLQQQQAFINASGVDPELANQYLAWDGQPDEALDTDALKAVADNPFLRYAKLLQPARDGLEKLPTMALPKALATLNAAKGSMAQVDQQMKLDQMVAQARLENIAAGLPDAVQKTRKVTTSGEAGVDANNPFFKNVEQVRAGLVKSGVTPEQVEAGVQDYIRKVESSIATSGATEEQKAGFAEAIAQYREGLRTDTGEVTDYGREDDYVQKTLADAYAAGQAAQKAPTPEGDALARMSESAAANINAKRVAQAEEKKTAATAQSEVRKAVLEVVSNGKAPTQANMYTQWGKILGGLGITWDGQQYVDAKGNNADRMEEVVKNEYMALMDKMGFSSLYRNVTSPSYEKEVAAKLKDNPELQTRVLSAIPESKARSEKLAAQGQKLADAKPTTAADVLASSEAAKPKEQSKPFGVGKLELGEETYDEFLTSIQKEAAAREFYKAKFGAVPVGFTDMYRKMYPEASVRSTTIKVNGQDIPIMIDSKGNATQLKQAEAPNVVEAAKAKAVTFANTEIADGVRLNGIFSGTVDGAQAFRKDYSHMANVRTAIARLVEINESGYETLSPSMRQEADQLQSEIIAALRVPIIGPGQVAVPEQEILHRIVKNPTGMFSLEASDRAALKGLMSRVDRELVNWPKSMGLEVNIAGNRSQTIRQLRLNRETKARMVGETN